MILKFEETEERKEPEPNYRIVVSLGVPDRLRSNIAPLQPVRFTYKEDRTRSLIPYKANPNLMSMSKSIWVAEITEEKQFIWRATKLADKTDVYKLLKFLVTQDTNQSIHINTGTHGFGGKSVVNTGNSDLADSKILKETKERIALLGITEERAENISVLPVNLQSNSIYPAKANHVVDTLCEGANYPAVGGGLKKPLRFLYSGPITEEIIFGNLAKDAGEKISEKEVLRKKRETILNDLKRGLGMDFNNSASFKVQDALERAIQVVESNPKIDRSHIYYTSGGALGLTPEWNIRLYIGEEKVWEDIGSASSDETLVAVGQRTVGPIVGALFGFGKK